MFIKLKAATRVNGTLRQPHDGVLQVGDDEAARLIGEDLAEDVSDDFNEDGSVAKRAASKAKE